MGKSWLFCVAVASMPALAGNHASPEAAEAAAVIERLRAVAAGITLPEPLQGQMTPITDSLAHARSDLDAGRVNLAWWRLSSSAPELTALQAYAVSTQDAAAFERERAGTGDLGAAAAKALADPGLARATAARRALAEAALNVVRRYEKSGSAFAKAAQAGSGIYYLNMARGNLEFAALSAPAPAGEVPGPAEGAQAAVASTTDLPELEDRLRRLEQEVAEAYAKPGAALARHAQFIALSATFKEARELDAAGLRHGALYKYLDARRRLRSVGDAPVAPREELARLLEATRTRLGAARGDQGIGWLFHEMAADSLSAEGSHAADHLRRADAALEGALAEYFDIVERRQAPSPAVAAAEGEEEVLLTLVRWPYT